jgi:hypothetical protein
MDRAMVERHLELAEKHVALGREHVATQQRIVADFESAGHDSGIARRLLATFEDLLRTHEADRDRIARELATLGLAGRQIRTLPDGNAY